MNIAVKGVFDKKQKNSRAAAKSMGSRPSPLQI